MSVPSARKISLWAGVFLAFVSWCSLNSNCSTMPNQADSGDAGQAIPTQDACPQDEKPGPTDSSVSTSSCSAGLGTTVNGPTSTTANPATASADSPTADSSIERVALTNPKPVDRNSEIYYRNKTELAFDLGTFPINIPFPFDFMEGDPYTEHPLKYTLVPIVISLRWQMSNLGGPWIFRGNWDLTSSGSFTWIPSGPETRFISYDMGLRRNFVPRNRNYANYWDIRLGVGQINAKGPKGVPFAQGENWPEFTMNLGTGVRYNFSPRFSFSAGLNYMHISNMDLSEHKPNATDPNWGPINYGINVFGPQLGINMRLGKPLHGE
jgi:Lipid A 3-O-deacylase (PagL)